ncbi:MULTISPECIES: ABC transporter ATP-binding protein [unclassified Mesorhizobium]|uniref:ABC transporter ATP-binding protein n=1 Tax=unclassified Mesorhizobium TaxID=325217 RepID=UPI001092147C|nr:MULTISPECIES: ABC transporter ATP-binding protein [unclassified Mesorhizobium]TGS43759.1 ABC transporter ATP-binding protein [Mesorhizobium sp. M8A.F.Ca.ET.182.01.1.1]TGS78340.1 ABC transporter ATP-binding protein [Mesorhizobium sp. M8A.F.Ca.ET.181.01.1.1]TGV15478.1 ABC transporter ATP-binding protein [Mesorhizobium sp. M8A.F.Ca.ET.173.01.1.1]
MKTEKVSVEIFSPFASADKAGRALPSGAGLTVEELTMRFGGLVAVDNVSLTAHQGEITAVIGPNGAGKTTLFNCITGFYRATSGNIRLAEASGEVYALEKMQGFNIARKAHVARTFQNIRLFQRMSLLDNLLVAQHNKFNSSRFSVISALLNVKGSRKVREDAIALARHWLGKVGLNSLADQQAGSLPYGAQRRLEIARAMCTEPSLLCLDEPAAGLNPRESLELNELLLHIKNVSKTTIILIEHDMSVVMKISDHVAVLDHGRKIAEGSPATIQRDPVVIAAYLGETPEDMVSEGLIAETTNAER